MLIRTLCMGLQQQRRTYLTMQHPDVGLLCVQVHYLSGPINVKDAEGHLAQPGDLLAVELCNLGPMPGQRLGPPASLTAWNH